MNYVTLRIDITSHEVNLSGGVQNSPSQDLSRPIISHFDSHIAISNGMHFEKHRTYDNNKLSIFFLTQQTSLIYEIELGSRGSRVGDEGNIMFDYHRLLYSFKVPFPPAFIILLTCPGNTSKYCLFYYTLRMQALLVSILRYNYIHILIM